MKFKLWVYSTVDYYLIRVVLYAPSGVSFVLPARSAFAVRLTRIELKAKCKYHQSFSI